MATEPQHSLMTAEELIELPDDACRYELDEGRLVSMPASGFQSSLVSADVLARMVMFNQQHQLGYVTGEQGGMRLARDPDTVRIPDVSFITRERISRIEIGFFSGAPDLAVEVLSPSDRFTAVMRKVSQFLAAGTRLVWVIDPFHRSAVVYRRSGEVVEFGEDGIIDGEDVLPGFTLPLAEIWV